MKSAVCTIDTTPLAEARYAILIGGTVKESFLLFDDAQYAYGRWLAEFQPEARTNVLLVRVEPVLPAGDDVDFY
jgi:hypothetical protein